MIILNNDWTFQITGKDCTIGYAGENDVYTLYIEQMGTEYAGWNFFMDVQREDEKDIWAVEKETQKDRLLLSIPIRRSYIPNGAILYAQLRASAPDGRVKKSAQMMLSVKGSINTLEMMPTPLPSEFEEYECRILDAKTAAEAAAGRAELAATKSPYIGATGTWYIWNPEAGAWMDTGISASGGNNWTFFSQTPCRVSGSSIGGVKLVSSTECSYHVYSDTVKDMESQPRSYYGGLSEDKSRGYYEFTLASAATAWYNVYFRMTMTGLEVGKQYKIYIDTTGLEPGSTTSTMLFGQFLIASVVNGAKGDTILGSTRISSAGLHGYTFTPATTDVMLEYYPGNVTQELVAGYQFRIRDLYVNYADAESTHTAIFNSSGTFTGEKAFLEYTDGLHYEATPACSVYYKEAKSRLFTVNGQTPDENGNVEIPKSKLAGKTLVCFGDSITGNFSPPVDYPSVIARLTGMTVYNLGLGGCRMSKHPDQYYDSFSMYRLADAIHTKDFSLQEAAVGHTFDYVSKRVDDLKNMDWPKVDYVTIFYGTNDIQGSVALDNSSNLYDTTTYLGAARYSLEKLWNSYPNLKILLLTPMYRYWDDTQTDSDEKTFAGGKHFYEFGEGLLQVAKEYKVPALDLYETLGINKFNRTHYFPPTDGTHPNDIGRELLGNKVAAKLLGEY